MLKSEQVRHAEQSRERSWVWLLVVGFFALFLAFIGFAVFKSVAASAAFITHPSPEPEAPVKRR